MSRGGPPGALREQALGLMQAGRVEEAIAAFEQLLRLAPAQADAWYNLGWLQHRAQQYEAALQSYRQALQHRIAQAEEVHLNRSVILAESLDRTEEAQAELERALALNPGYLPAWLNLGNLHEQQGRREPACRAYTKALALDVHNAVALARLASLRSGSGAAGSIVNTLRQALLRPGLPPLDRAELGFALGQVLDGAGAHDEAFAAYAEANRASRVAFGGVRYDAQAHEQRVDRLIAAFGGNNATASAVPGDTRVPIFICGLFRSGSSLVEQILASHPQVHAGGEIDLLPRLAERTIGPQAERAAQLDAGAIEALRRTYLQGIAARRRGSGWLTDKRPDNFLHLGLILGMFPAARIVHTRRDPVDTCLSMYFLHLGPSMPYALDLQDLAHWHGQYRRLMRHWKAAFGGAIHDVDYDELVLNPRPVVERLLAHCGLPWHEACLDFHTTPGNVRTPSAWQVRQPLYRHASGRWKRYRVHLDPQLMRLELP